MISDSIVKWLVLLIAISTAVLVLLMVLWFSPAHARDPDGRYAQSPLRSWFNGLASKRGNCCSFADGRTVSDVDVDMRPDGYYVRIDGQWLQVPPEALVEVPNKAGVPIVWPYEDVNHKLQIRCFIPGAGT
jgi:hypothetical protein